MENAHLIDQDEIQVTHDSDISSEAIEIPPPSNADTNEEALDDQTASWRLVSRQGRPSSSSETSTGQGRHHHFPSDQSTLPAAYFLMFTNLLMVLTVFVLPIICDVHKDGSHHVK